MSALRFENVSKLYDREGGRQRAALRDVSLSADEGRVVAVMGRSGSGKSTLLNLAAGIDVPSRGRVLMGGRDLAHMAEAERTRLRRDSIGMIFQFFHLLPHLSVEQNVLLPDWIAGGQSADGRRRAGDLLERVGLADRAGDSVEVLSGGEMQRVAICRALLRRPRLLLADEPTGNLDDDNGHLVMGLLLDLVRSEGSTLIYVTHDPDQAALADETWRLHSGTLEQA